MKLEKISHLQRTANFALPRRQTIEELRHALARTQIHTTKCFVRVRLSVKTWRH